MLNLELASRIGSRIATEATVVGRLDSVSGCDGFLTGSRGLSLVQIDGILGGRHPSYSISTEYMKGTRPL